MTQLYKKLDNNLKPIGGSITARQIDAGSNVSLSKEPNDAVLAKLGYVRWVEDEKPLFDSTVQKLIDGTETKAADGSFVLTFKVIGKSAEELEADRIAALRLFSPAKIINALVSLDKAKAFLASMDEQTKVQLLYTGQPIREDNPTLLKALDAASVMLEDLKAVI